MNTAEYAVGTLAAVAFAGLLLKVLTSDPVQNALGGSSSGRCSDATASGAVGLAARRPAARGRRGPCRRPVAGPAGARVAGTASRRHDRSRAEEAARARRAATPGRANAAAAVAATAAWRRHRGCAPVKTAAAQPWSLP